VYQLGLYLIRFLVQGQRVYVFVFEHDNSNICGRILMKFIVVLGYVTGGQLIRRR